MISLAAAEGRVAGRAAAWQVRLDPSVRPHRSRLRDLAPKAIAAMSAESTLCILFPKGSS